MAVTCANDVSGDANQNPSKRSPVLHTVVHNLLEGLKVRDDIEIEVIYGRQHPDHGENRNDGCVHYLPIPYKPVPIPGMGGPYLARTLALLDHIKKSNPDIVHGQGTERESGLVAALSGKPSILTLHGNFRKIRKSISAPFWSYYGLTSIVETLCIPKVSLVHCLSPDTRDSVRGSARSVTLLPNAVDPFYFSVQRSNFSAPYILFIGGITEWKNPTLLSEASDEMMEAYPDLECHFIGGADPGSEYGKRFFSSLDRRPWCYYHGKLKREQIGAHLAKASCTVVPSIEDNCPTVILESLAAGVPCIGSDTGGIPFLIKNGKSGYVFKSKKANELTSCVVNLHSDSSKWQDISRFCRGEARERFSIESIALAHHRMYRTLAKK